MIKTIQVGDKAVKFSNNIGWCFEYRNQFGHDIIPVLMPALNGLVSAAVTLAARTDGADDLQTALSGMDPSEITDIMIQFAGLQFTDMVNVLWAMAKTVDADIPEPTLWVREFDSFPLDVVVPEALDLIMQGVVSRKNYERLRQALSKLRATPQS